MRKSNVKSMIHDLLNLDDYDNPLNDVYLEDEKVIDLLDEDVIPTGLGGIWNFYAEKVRWFQTRVKGFKGDLRDFIEAKIYVKGNKERIKIIYKDTIFEGEKSFDSYASYLAEKNKSKENR